MNLYNDHEIKILDYRSEALIEKFAPKLRALAKKSFSNQKHAALILDKKGHLICGSYNKKNLHAEYDAILKWLRAYFPRGRRAEYIVVARLGRDGFGISKPCSRCEEMINAFRLKVAHT